MATGGPRRLWHKAVPSMTIFWLKTRMGWKETAQMQHTVGSYDLSRLSDDDLERAFVTFMASHCRSRGAGVPASGTCRR
jgi:hypothetical protein